MLHSSTSSSDRRSGGWWWVAGIVLLIGLTAEGLLRLPAVRGHLPPRTHFYHQSISTRLDALERVTGTRGRIDVLFTGSSIVGTDVDPARFDAAFDPEAPLVSFNAAMDGIWPIGVELYTRRLWLDAARPRVVVQGIRFPELRVTTAAKHHTQIWSGTVEAGWRRGDVLDTLESLLTSRLLLLQYRGALTTALRRYADGAPGEGLDDPPVRGYKPRPTAAARVEELEPDLPNDGTCQDGCEAAFAAIRRTRDAVRRTGAVYILFNVPEHGSRWRGPGGVDRYHRYLAAVRAFASADHIPFVDVTDGDPFRFDGPDHYGDLSHMTHKGSLPFTLQLASQVKSVLASRENPILVTSTDDRSEDAFVPSWVGSPR